MTLCAAWIRKVGDTDELVFVTDSTLTGGEKWNHGVKLFELPRPDCLLCFAGQTFRAYPLLLNLATAIKHNDRLRNPKLDIVGVLHSVADIFTELVGSIFEKPKGNTDTIGAEAQFLFGGWSWQANRFRIWKLHYSADSESFIYKEESQGTLSRVCVFLGDPEDHATTALKRYQQVLTDMDKFDAQLDMEPLRVLIDMSRDNTIREVDGALQIGKIYRSGSNEFFGIVWPSVDGDYHFLGKKYAKHNKPHVRYYDPDTCELLEDQIPKSLANLTDFVDSSDYAFLQDCYSQDQNYLKTDVSEREREQLIGIFREYSYQAFRVVAEAGPALTNSQNDTADE